MTEDGTYLYICGTTFTSSTNNFDFVTLMIRKSDGAIQWAKTFNGSASNYDIATSIVLSSIPSQAGIFVTGIAYNTSTSLDYHTIKYDDGGNVIWQQTMIIYL